MKYTALVILLVALGSCSSIEGKGVQVRSHSDIPLDKAIIIMGLIAQKEGARFFSGGSAYLNVFEEQYKEECNKSEVAREYHGEFCNADYIFSYSDDPLCDSSARVIETCNKQECTYKVGSYSDICE